MRFILLNLDPVIPIQRTALEELCSYVRAYFNAELKVVDVPVTPIAPEVPPGWEALKERCQATLQSKPGREGAVAPSQLLASQLLNCLYLVHQDPERYGVDCQDSECVLGVTLNEFYHDPSGLRPDEPVPEEGTKDFFIASVAKRVGAISLAQLEFVQAPRPFTTKFDLSKGSTKFPRNLFKLVTNSLLKLLGLRNCASHRCCAYMKPFSPTVTPLHLCYSCEEALLKKTHSGDTSTLLKAAGNRYSDIRKVLEDVNARMKPVLMGHRRFVEFEEECDWLLLAEEILTEISSERFRFGGTEGPQCRRRSVGVCLREVHERQPPRMLHRIHSEPLLKRTCLLDMQKSAPHRHESGEMHKWTTLVWNRKHTSGGHYAETGGSLKPKTVGMFMESGLNASLVQKAPGNKMFVGGLSESTTSQSLRKYFEQYGATEGQVTLDPNHSSGGRSKGYGSVTFKNADQLQEALQQKHIVDGKAVDCRASVVKAITEKMHKKIYFHGRDTWKKELAGALDKSAVSTEVLQRAGSRLASTEEWQPTRSRKNALSLSYTLPASFSTIA